MRAVATMSVDILGHWSRRHHCDSRHHVCRGRQCLVTRPTDRLYNDCWLRQRHREKQAAYTLADVSTCMLPPTLSSNVATELLQPPDLACGTLFQSSCVIPTSPTHCSDDSWRDTFLEKHEHGALWLLICGAIEKHLLTYLVWEHRGNSNCFRGHRTGNEIVPKILTNDTVEFFS